MKRNVFISIDFSAGSDGRVGIDLESAGRLRSILTGTSHLLARCPDDLEGIGKFERSYYANAGLPDKQGAGWCDRPV